MFDKFAETTNAEPETDYIPTSGPVTTDIYEGEIKSAYMIESANGAYGMVLEAKLENGQTHSETVYMTSNKANGQKNTYIRNGKEHYLPGFNNINNLSLLAAGKPIGHKAISDTVESKTVKVAKWENGKRTEVPTSVEMVMGLIGKKAYFAIVQNIEDVNAEDPNIKGNYIPTGYTRLEAKIDKTFKLGGPKDKMTATEIKAGATEASYFGTWLEANKGKQRDRSAAKNGHNPKPKNGSNQSVTGNQSTESNTVQNTEDDLFGD